MKKFGLLFCLAVFTLTSTGSFLCADKADTVELVLQGIPRKDARSLTERIGREVFENFLKKHPNIKVRELGGVRLENQQRMDSVVMSFAGGTAPDVVMIPFRNVTTFIEQGFLYPLDEYYNE